MRKIPLYDQDFYTHYGEQGDFDLLIIREVREFYDYMDVFRWSEINSIIDVGAHIGAYAAYAHYRQPGCKIICVEPEPVNAMLCVKNVGNFAAVHQGYVRYKTDDLVLVVSPHNTGNCGMHPVEDIQRLQHDYIRMSPDDRYTIEDLMEQHDLNRLDILKLDVEGCEYDILAGIAPETKRKIRLIVGEYHGTHTKFRDVAVPMLEKDFYLVHVGTRELGRFCFANKELT